jgi:hypothetical protein
MVQIIEDSVAGPTEAPHLELYVYRSPSDGETVMGYLCSDGFIQGGGAQIPWISTLFGVPVEDAYLRTLDLARHHGVERVWLNDPEGLFPTASRPKSGAGH